MLCAVWWLLPPLLPPGSLPKTAWAKIRVADPGCLSRIPDPDFYPSRGSRIQKQQQKRGVKKISCHNFLCSHKFLKIANCFSFEVLKKKIWANFQRIIELFTQNIVNKLSKIWVWDPGSEIRDPEKTYPGSRGQKGTGSRIRIRNTVGYAFLRPSFWAKTFHNEYIYSK
jgi:hypothetical protein